VTARIVARSVAAVSVATVAALAGCTAPPPEPAGSSAVVESNEFFADAAVAESIEAIAGGDGDLWANCWADDDNVYAAYGDGRGFGGDFADIGVAVITGEPGTAETSTLAGENLAAGDEVGQVWVGDQFTRKPTGMVCVGGDLYLAVQDLRLDFNEAPAATIAKSTDKGRTWTWDESAPMFDDHVFTTVFFLDYGKDGEHAPDGFVYAYGLDGNWRDSFDDSVPDPVDVYLARVPTTSIQDRSAWQFFTGAEGDNPQWSDDIDERVAVLHDDRLLYPSSADDDATTVGVRNLSVISQGGVVYDQGLDRYLYTSWTELTFEFYESPTPWGPFELFLSKDFGPYPWTLDSHGGYGTTIPSKFISADGRSMWLQSNVCPCAPAEMSVYDFALRPMTVEPAAP
jgi:hypothetical protein